MTCSNARDGTIPTNEPRLSTLAVVAARKKGKESIFQRARWTDPTKTWWRQLSPPLERAKARADQIRSHMIDQSCLNQFISGGRANFASFLYITSLVHCRQVQYMLRNWLHLTYPEEWQKVTMEGGLKGASESRREQLLLLLELDIPNRKCLNRSILTKKRMFWVKIGRSYVLTAPGQNLVYIDWIENCLETDRCSEGCQR